MVIASIEAGNTESMHWVGPHEDAPALAALWDGGNGVFYLAGEIAASERCAALRAQLTARRREVRLSRFKIRAFSPAIEAALPELFPDVSLQLSRSFFLTLHPDTPSGAPEPRAVGTEILPITRHLIEETQLDGIDIVTDEIASMWPSPDRFFEHGFGVIARVRDEVACFCTAEYVGPAHCGIGIATAPTMRDRGIATAVGAAFIAEARDRGLTPCWECAADNLPSVRVAEKLGFTLEAEETYWIAHDSPPHP